MRDQQPEGVAGVSVVPLAPSDSAEYSAFLTEFDDSLIYYSLGFRSFLEDLLHCGSQYWVARESGRITGVLPLMWRDGPLGRVINSLPFYGSNGGVLGSTDAARDALTRKFNEASAAADVASATWVCHPLRPPEATAVTHDMEDERVGQVTSLDLGDDPASGLNARIDGSARRNIRKAHACNVRVTVDNDRWDFLEQVHRDNMAGIHGKPKPRQFFASLPRHLKAGQDYQLYVAERAGAPIAAMLLLYFHKTVEYYIPVTIESQREFQPTALILWQAMLDAASAGYRLWNWGGTWLSQSGVWRFKRKWGAQDHRYRYFVRLNSSAIMDRSRSELLAAYPDFYVVPFDRLKQG